MLVLTRKTSESIVIGNDITVTVLEVRGDQVRIGIHAPRSVQVHREEIFQQPRPISPTTTADQPDLSAGAGTNGQAEHASG